MYIEISSKNYLDDCIPLGSSQRATILNLADEIEKQKLYKGKGGEIIRIAVCHFIHSISQSGLKLETKELLQIFGTLKDNLKQTNVEIQDYATIALHSFCNFYF